MMWKHSIAVDTHTQPDASSCYNKQSYQPVEGNLRGLFVLKIILLSVLCHGGPEGIFPSY